MLVEEQGESEGRPVIGRIGVARSPYVKTGRLPYGLSSQENRQNFINGRKANECRNSGMCTIRPPLAYHQVGKAQTSGKKAASAYCEGITGRLIW